VPRGIAAIGRVDDRSVRQPEDISEPAVPVTATRLPRGIAAALIDAEVLAFVKVLRRKGAVAVDTALADVDHREGSSN